MQNSAPGAEAFTDAFAVGQNLGIGLGLATTSLDDFQSYVWSRLFIHQDEQQPPISTKMTAQNLKDNIVALYGHTRRIAGPGDLLHH